MVCEPRAARAGEENEARNSPAKPHWETSESACRLLYLSHELQQGACFGGMDVFLFYDGKFHNVTHSSFRDVTLPPHSEFQYLFCCIHLPNFSRLRAILLPL